MSGDKEAGASRVNTARKSGPTLLSPLLPPSIPLPNSHSTKPLSQSQSGEVALAPHFSFKGEGPKGQSRLACDPGWRTDSHRLGRKEDQAGKHGKESTKNPCERGYVQQTRGPPRTTLSKKNEERTGKGQKRDPPLRRATIETLAVGSSL